MQIPGSKIERFVRGLVEQCTQSQMARITRGGMYRNYYLLGSDNPDGPAMYNKCFAYLDDLESLLYSPVSLAFHIGDPDEPNALNIAKGRAAAARLGTLARRSSTDTMMSEAVCWSLVKGKAFVKMKWSRGQLAPDLVQSELMGVAQENLTRLDEDMEFFVHSTYITKYQFARMVWNHPDKAELLKKIKRYTKPGREGRSPDLDATAKQIIVGGLYPYQSADSPTPNKTRGIVDWMGNPSPQLSPEMLSELIRLDEVWAWDDARQDWATFQIVGDDMLIMGRYRTINAFAYNPASKEEWPELKGHHPFVEFCPNRIDGYFWGRSEICNVALLQEAINSRLAGINRMLRKQEDPPTKFIGSSGVNQNALARLRKPGGYYTDSNPNAKVEDMTPQIPGDLWESLAEYERMFDEMGGLPPIAKGRGESGVRSQGHAETLVRMFSPRFKDRALLVERDVEACGSLMLDLAEAHDPKVLTAWLPQAYAGMEADPQANPFLIPPAPGLVPVRFELADLDDDMSVTVNSHSSSPAFAAEARALSFDLYKIGAMDQQDVIESVDAPNAAELIAGVQRRGAEKAAQIAKLEPAEQLKLLEGGKKK